MGQKCCCADGPPEGGPTTVQTVRMAEPGPTLPQDVPETPRAAEPAKAVPETPQAAEPAKAMDTPEAAGTPEGEPAPAAGEISVTLGFLDHEGERRDVVIRHLPLGADFKKVLPLRVERVKPGGQGEELGIKEGWTVEHMNGVAVKDMEFEQVYKMLGDALKVLPKQTKPPDLPAPPPDLPAPLLA
mmetsp:Transcript_16145/g.50731  ORF Transcript_16145/g.50731 Transcript_16145/m.50731 type:complete len:186 (+) Transcript_16145:976-1533(+)